MVVGVVLAWLGWAAATVVFGNPGPDATMTGVTVRAGLTVLVAGLLATAVGGAICAGLASRQDQQAAIGLVAVGAAGYLVVAAVLTVVTTAVSVGLVQLVAGLVGPGLGAAAAVAIARRR